MFSLLAQSITQSNSISSTNSPVSPLSSTNEHWF